MKVTFSTSVLLALLLASCSTTQYISDNLKDLNPSQYTTYTMEDNCSDEINPIMQIRFKNALEKKLRNQGYNKNGNADILVKYFVKNLSKKYVEECREEYQRWEGGRECQERVITYVEGSLIVDIIDTNSNAIVWHGAAYGPSWKNIKNPNDKIDEIVSRLLDKYFQS